MAKKITLFENQNSKVNQIIYKVQDHVESENSQNVSEEHFFPSIDMRNEVPCFIANMPYILLNLFT